MLNCDQYCPTNVKINADIKFQKSETFREILNQTRVGDNL